MTTRRRLWCFQTPLDLVSSASLPATLEWVALKEMPAAPSSLADVQGLAIQGMNISATWGLPQYFSPLAATWRTWNLCISGPSDPGGYPYSWAGLAVVDTDGGGRLLALFPTADGNTLAHYGQSQVVSGYIQVSEYNPDG